MVEPEDNLGIANNLTLKNNLGEEQIYFSDKIQKKTKEVLFSKTQERIFVVTDLAIYNIKGNEIKRRIKIEDLKGITVSKTSNQFIIHCNQNEYDYLYIYPKRKKIVKMLQSVYENKTSKDLLFCQKNDKDLSKFVVTKKERTKSPYLFKIEQNELTSIKDYIENDNISEEPEPIQQSQKASPPPPPESSGPVKVVASKGKGVPPPPPPPPPPPKVATVPSSKPTSNKPVDLAAELAAKKNNLSHVEVKDYVSPALQKPEEGGVPQTGNSMMAAIMAKRNQMKKVGGAGAASGGAKPPARPVPRASAPSVAPPKPVPRASAPVIPAVHATNNPTTGGPKFPAAAAPKPAVPKPATNTGARPPMKMGGGGGGGGAFAAKMAALQARMAGPSGGGGGSSSSSTPASTGPSKPIVELCEGNTKRMDINKVIGNLEKEKKKQASKSSSKPVEVKVVSGKGKGIPPPPPPPPPPPKLK